MAQIAVNSISSTLIPLIEDPYYGNLRMFIQGTSFQANTLSPNWMEWFQPYGTSGIWGTTTSYAQSYSTPQNGLMMLSGGTIHGTALSNQSAVANPYNKIVTDTYNRSLDFANYPTQMQWATKNGYAVFCGPDINNSGVGGWFQVLNPSYSNPSVVAVFNTSSTTSYGNQIIYEDTTNNRLWMLCCNNTSSNASYINAVTNYETSSPTSGASINWANYFNSAAIGQEVFFMGVDSSNYLWFCGVGNANNYYSIIRVHPTTYAVTSVVTNSNQGNSNPDSYSKRRPSNIRRDSSSRRVFYSAHFNASNQLQPNRYVWDPTNVSGNVAVTACTMTYPGSNTYATYGSMNTPSSTGWSGVMTNGYASETWHTKPYQFSLGGTNYITFFNCDKYPTSSYSNSPYMWATAANRVAITYSLGAAGADNNLTYHSSFDMGYSTMWRDFIPLNSSGITLAVPQNDLLYFWTFNAVSGWQQSGPYPVNPRVLGLDQLGRLWAQVGDVGYGSVHVVTPTTPITVNVAMSSSSFTYTGSNIAASANVTVSNASGYLMGTTVFLTINGSSMVFSNTGLKTQTITTSNVGGAIANLTITGGGYNTISASITSSL